MNEQPPSLPAELSVAHVSDTHIGYEAYRAVSAAGENQRSVDVARAFMQAGEDIAAWDPPLVIHSGDIAERPQIPVRLMLLVRKWLTDLAALRPDGSRRQVVVIAGNHDLPAQRREACFLELFANIPGVHIVTDRVKTVTFDGAGQPGGAATELADVHVHAIPHDCLKDLGTDGGFDDITPDDHKVNILVGHGVAGGSTLYRRVLGREYAIPTELLGRNWDYVALGHWHRPGPVGTTGKKVETSRVWYAGSTENMGFGDVLDNTGGRGWLKVSVRPGAVPAIERSLVHNRTMFRLPVLEGAGLSPEQIEAELLARVRDEDAAGNLDGSVVGQVVTGVPREVWALVDLTRVRDAAAHTLHYEVTVKPVKREADDEASQSGPRDLSTTLEEVIKETLGKEPPERRKAVSDFAGRLLGEHLARPADDTSGTEDNPESPMKPVIETKEEAA